MNNVNLIGRLTKKPEIKATPKGKLFTKFTLAVPGFKKEETEFVLVECWEKQAETVVAYVDKGHRVAITGSIKSDSYEKDERKVFVTYVLANRVEFLEPTNKKEDGNETKNETVPLITDDDLPF